MNPQYINQDLGPLLHIGYIEELDDISYALFQIKSQILEDYGLCIESGQGNSEEDNDGINNGTRIFGLLKESFFLLSPFKAALYSSCNFEIYSGVLRSSNKQSKH